jgi:hypothetical protein
LKKQLTILVLLVIINLPFLGFYACFNYRKHEIKTKIQTEINSGIIQSEIINLEFTREETLEKLTWLTNREFKYDEMVYQVLKVKYKGEKIIYSCRINYESANLLTDIDKLVDSALGRNSANQKASESLTNFFNNLYCYSSTEIISPILVPNLSFDWFTSERLILRYAETTDPPPKFNIC